MLGRSTLPGFTPVDELPFEVLGAGLVLGQQGSSNQRFQEATQMLVAWVITSVPDRFFDPENPSLGSKRELNELAHHAARLAQEVCTEPGTYLRAFARFAEAVGLKPQAPGASPSGAGPGGGADAPQRVRKLGPRPSRRGSPTEL